MVGLTTYYQDEKGLHFAEFVTDEAVPVIEPFTTNCKVQVMRDGTMCVSESPKRARSNSVLIRKAAHGRLSGTRDKAFQLTLKCFASEGIDWQKAFVVEPIEVLTDLMGKVRMREILTNVLNRLNSEAYGL